MAVVDDLERALVGRRVVIGIGVTDRLLPGVDAARNRTDGGTWRIRCPPGVVDQLSRAFVLGTAVAEAVDDESIELRTAPATATANPPTTVFVTGEAVHAVVGPSNDRTVVTEPDATVVEDVRMMATGRFDSGKPASISMPGRSRLIDTARSYVGERFAEDIESVLSAAEFGAFMRSTPVSDRVLLLALGARHDHLFATVRAWADDTGIAASQTFTEPRRVLERAALIESVKVPMGVGHPNYRLRALDPTLVHGSVEEVVERLCDGLSEHRRTDQEPRSGRASGPTGRHAADAPVWDREE
ncbi:hypothetical protein JCM18237_12480 [Halorubrum luteum]